MKALYENSKRFREYVDRYCKARGTELSEALTHSIVKSVAQYYKGLENESK